MEDARSLEGVNSLGSTGGMGGAADEVQEGEVSDRRGRSARSWDTDGSTRALQRQLVALNQGTQNGFAMQHCGHRTMASLLEGAGSVRGFSWNVQHAS